MGLLDRAKSTLPEPEEGWIQFIKTLDSLNKGVDFSIALYRSVISYFDIEKSALFFRSDNNSNDFKCLSSQGYDKTTGNRLRLDERAVDSDVFNLLNSDRRCGLNQASSLSFFSDYFSSREFGLLEDLYWISFQYDGEVICLIMISQWKSFPPSNWKESFYDISRRYSYQVYESRKPLSGHESVSIEKIDDQSIKQFIMNRQMPDVHIFAIDLSVLIEQLVNVNVGMSRVNLKKEIISVFKTMSGPNQGLLDLDNQMVLFMLDKARVRDISLFIHQLSASLPLLFQDLTQAPDLNVIELSLPENEDDWAVLTGKLLR